MGNIFHAGFGLEGFLLLFDLFLLLIHPAFSSGLMLADNMSPMVSPHFSGLLNKFFPVSNQSVTVPFHKKCPPGMNVSKAWHKKSLS